MQIATPHQCWRRRRRNNDQSPMRIEAFLVRLGGRVARADIVTFENNILFEARWRQSWPRAAA